MRANKNEEVSTGSTGVSISTTKKYLSPVDLEARRKSPGKVSECYIEALGGYVHFRESSAKTMRDFINIGEKEDIPKSEMISCLAGFASDVLCDENGSDFISLDQALGLSLATLDDICTGVSEGLKGPKSKRSRGSRGNASRR